MLTAAGHSPLCENQREEVEMEDTGDAGPGHVPRATCRQSGGHGSLGRWSSAGAARGQFVTNNTKYLCNIAMLLIGTHKLLPDKYLDFVTLVKP